MKIILLIYVHIHIVQSSVYAIKIHGILLQILTIITIVNINCSVFEFAFITVEILFHNSHLLRDSKSLHHKRGE